MAHHIWSETQFYGAERKFLSGQFLPASSTTSTTTALSLVTQTSGANGAIITMKRGLGFTVKHDASNTGQYNVLLDQDYTDILAVDPTFTINAVPGATPSVICAPGLPWIPNANANIAAGTGQLFHFALMYIVGTTPTDMGTSANSTIGFLCVMKNTQSLA